MNLPQPLRGNILQPKWQNVLQRANKVITSLISDQNVQTILDIDGSIITKLLKKTMQDTNCCPKKRAGFTSHLTLQSHVNCFYFWKDVIETVF
jgi:hypothetical protein